MKTRRYEKGETDPAAVLPFDKDNIWFVDLKWSGLDFLEVRIGYENFDQDTDYRTIQSQLDPTKRFPYTAQERNTYKAILDIFPLENLNLGFEYRHRNIDYSDTTYGLKRDRRNEFETSADYIVGKIAKVYGYGNFGWIEFDRLQQKTEGIGTPADWGARQKDTTYGYGIGAEIYAIPKKLTFIFQHDYVKSNGSVDFTLDPVFFTAGGGAGLNGIGANNSNIDITRWDDYTLYYFKIKAVYNFTKSLSASIGYAYERFKYSDAQLDNYNFTPTGGTNAAFLTGAYKESVV